MIYEGRPRIDIDVIDASVILKTGLKGVAGVIGETERGPINTPVLVRTWEEFRKYFGELPENWVNPKDTLFPWLCQRSLNGGAALVVVRVDHYTDITDRTTGTSIKPTATVAGILFTGVDVGDYRAKVSVAKAASGLADKFDITCSLPNSNVTPVVYKNIDKVVTAGVAALFKDKVRFMEIGTGEIVLGDSAYQVETQTIVGAIEAAGEGDINVIVTSALVTGSPVTLGVAVANNDTAIQVAGKVRDALNANANITAHYIVGGLNDKVILTAKVYAANDTTLNIAYNNGTALGLTPNATSESTVEGSVSSVTLEESLLSGGSYAFDSLVDADYIGESVSSTGIRALDSVKQIIRVSVPHKALGLIDIALANYADLRKDIRALVRTPVGLNGAGILDYRKGTGIYAHTAIDTHRASMFTGGILARNPVTNILTEIPEIADVIAVKAKKDNKYSEWFAAAGPKYPFANVEGVVYDLSSPAKASEWDDVSKAGVNAVINHAQYGICPWDNRTLQVADTMLKHENVSELVVFLFRSLKPLVESMHFDPNDILTWKAIHRTVTKFLDNLVTGRAIQADYLYQGDQNIEDMSEAVINDPADVDKGGYKVKIFVKPITALKYIGIEVTLTNTGVNLAEI